MNEERLSPFQLVILGLSIFVLVALAATVFFDLSPETVRLLLTIDTIACVIFLWDFFYRLFRAEKKLEFLKWGWIDFVSSIPMIEPLRWGRFFRVLRILRIMRGFRSARTLLAFVFRNRQESAFAISVFTALMFLFFGSIAILEIEREADDANIVSAQDAIWWAIVTMTTVGYGDRFPVTTEGRLLAVPLMVVGIGLFGTLSGLMASFLLGKRQDEKDALAKLDAKTHEILKRLEQREWTRPAKGGKGPSRPRPPRKPKSGNDKT